VAGGSLPPSLIFAGPSGIGKRETAIALAQELNCPATGDPAAAACGSCAVCTRIARGVHPDVLIVEPGDSGSIKIEQVRDLIERAAYRPFEGKRRVVIIDEADTLMAAAQNALLKTLEEPPSSSMFVLVTSRPDALLGTLRSRCIQLRFSEGAVYIVDVEARQVAERVLTHAASAPDARRRIEGAKELLTNTGSGGASDREILATHLLAMSSLVRDAALVAANADAATLANPDARPAIDRLARVFHGERAIRAFGAVDGALAALDRNAGVKIVADWLVLQL
jgi:DNA polymerase-3 subunit delta'